MARKAITLKSPLYDPEWILYPSVPLAVEDLILGCLRSYKAELNTTGEYVSYPKLLSVLYNDEEISSKGIETRLGCPARTARKYMQVAKTIVALYNVNPGLFTYRPGSVEAAKTILPLQAIDPDLVVEQFYDHELEAPDFA